ncbi:MAG TPA: alpha/beta hydrolase-fold protein, partial [Gemmataceae bacterium]|nr:alpha/beta hydrolase-fold protein [Gemmataceae bacterium]
FLTSCNPSPYQAGTTLIRVLTPDEPETGRRYPAVYVLPVEAGTESRYGDGLQEVKKLGLHNKLKAVFVAPTFSHLPWYADHPTRPEVRQESHLLKAVVPFVEKTYPVRAEPEGRLLLGFSKSGWGAYALLLRHPDVFGRAAAWDAPLTMDRPGPYRSGDVFGTPENFAGYRVTRLLEARAKEFRTDRRLILLGYGNFRDDHRTAHELMEKLKIANEYRDGPARKHDWHGGWVKEAADLLLAAPKDGRSP